MGHENLSRMLNVGVIYIADRDWFCKRYCIVKWKMIILGVGIVFIYQNCGIHILQPLCHIVRNAWYERCVRYPFGDFSF